MIITPSNKVLLLGWESVSESREKGFFDFEFITWMAWTWQTALFFVFIALCLTAMVLWEKKVPGGTPRRGVLGLDTTRGDRLFISLLSAAFIHLAWLDHCPNVVVDARAAACQIICSSAGGTKEIAGPSAIVIEEDEWDFEPVD